MVALPAQMNEMFARAFNRRSIDALLALYEPHAILRVDGSERSHTGLDAIREELEKLLQLPGTMTSVNNFCVVQDELALLRADWVLTGEDSSTVTSGSSAEVVRRQPDGTWRYIIDHAVGGGLPRVI